MCGRAFLSFDDSKASKQIQKRIEQTSLFDFKKGELFPSENILTLIPAENNKIDVAVKKWGFNNNGLLINARIEGLGCKPTFRSFVNQRCAVVANGYFEWNNKQKYYISDTKDQLFYLACIYNDKDEFVILTHRATNTREIHDRSPLILNQKEMIEYLHGKNFDHSSNISLEIKSV